MLQEALHLENHGRASLNRAIFMLTEQNTYNVKCVARRKETEITFQASMANLELDIMEIVG